ncbi:MAG: tRNA pseudouridine(55) synthase TruB [Fimbriimonadaceae bacterium]
MRKVCNTKRIGHAGTLDPLATGLLVVAVGPATRFLQYLDLEPKVYEATVKFGVETTTQDREGDIVAELPTPTDLASVLEVTLTQFRGLIDQVPSIYSAVKKDGQPLYKYARQGIEVEVRPRRVHIAKLEVTAWVASDEAILSVECSGGTYVRTLAHDIGEALGCGAHLSALRRTKVGKFPLSDSKPLDEVRPFDIIPLSQALIPPSESATLDEGQIRDIRMGRAIDFEAEYGEGPVVLIDEAENVVGIAKYRCNQLHPECVIPAPMP